MKPQLSHAEIERIIDEQERELDTLTREYNLMEMAGAPSLDLFMPRPSRLKRGWWRVRRFFRRTLRGFH